MDSQMFNYIELYFTLDICLSTMNKNSNYLIERKLGILFSLEKRN